MTNHQVRTQLPARTLLWIGFGSVAAYIAVLLVLAQHTSYDIWGGWVIAPILIVVTLPMIARQARREGDRLVFWILLAGLLLKFVGAIARYVSIWVLYHGRGDAVAYHQAGVEISTNFLHGIFDIGHRTLSDTGFIDVVTGVIYTITRPTMMGGFFVFAWLAFIGMYLCYRAFLIAVPQGRARTYSYLLFFLPSLVFWSSSIGKEGWMTLAFGLAAFGAAKILERGWLRGLLPFAIGVAAASFVRGHEGGVIVISLAFALLLKKPKRSLGELTILVKIATVALALGLAAGAYVYARSSLQRSGLDTSGGVSSILQQTQDRTAEGGSQFQTYLPTTPVGVVLATGTVLFRPLVIEAGSAQELASALESSFLLLLCLVRWRWVLSGVRNMRRSPYIAFSIALTMGLVFSFSTISNFGILARQRVLLIPFFLVLLAVPPSNRPVAVGSQPAPEEVREPLEASVAS